jgi:triacylglycerol lipase
MIELNPSEAAELADGVYDVQNELDADIFLSHPLFGRGKSRPTVLKADVGGRVILNVKDGFGVFSEGNNVNSKELFLIFRGTTSENHGADFLTDARMGITTNDAGLPVHCGFKHCFTSMLGDIKKFIEAYPGSGYTVHCLGHSLGGAVASLAADWVARHTKHTVKLYTFGAPRVGTDWFVKSTTTSIGSKHIHRAFHRTDPVPMVPLYPFMHAPYKGESHYLNSEAPLFSGEAHKMENYIHSVLKKSWTDITDVQDNIYGSEGEVERWLKSKSFVDASSAAFWRWVDSALIYVLKKITIGSIALLQGVFITGFTLADKIAYILAKGIELADHISVWVECLMRKLMQALGMAVAKTKEELTRSLIRVVLGKIMEKLSREARNAINKINI